MIKSATLKRIAREKKQLDEQPIREFVAEPLEDNALEWHFTITGPADSPYAQGLYHGRLLIPGDYPFQPADVVLLTPNGRFELDKRICLSISSYHPENWHPTWGINTVLHALREFMSTPGNNAIGAIEYPKEVRERLAVESRTFICPTCHVSVAEQWEAMKEYPLATEADRAANVPATPDLRAKTGPATPSPLMTPSASPQRAVGDDTAQVFALPPASPLADTPQPAEAANEGGGPEDAVLPPPVVQQQIAEIPPAPVVAAARAPQLQPQPHLVDLTVSIETIDRLLFIALILFGVLLAKKCVFDWSSDISSVFRFLM